MPIGPFEREVLLLLAKHRNPESYIGGATVLNQSVESPRRSKDIDVFHDTVLALQAGLALDHALLRARGYTLDILFQAPAFCRAVVEKDGQSTKMEWVYDSAFRFFPVESDSELGYRLNFWDAATNKVLAGIGRGVIRDYVDLLYLHGHYLSLGALIWAAAGKDPGVNPCFICNELSRAHRYSPVEYATLQLEKPVDPEALRKQWRQALDEAEQLFETVLSDAPVGCFFLDAAGQPQTPTESSLGDLTRHFGTVGGCWPRVVDENR